MQTSNKVKHNIRRPDEVMLEEDTYTGVLCINISNATRDFSRMVFALSIENTREARCAFLFKMLTRIQGGY